MMIKIKTAVTPGVKKWVVRRQTAKGLKGTFWNVGNSLSLK